MAQVVLVGIITAAAEAYAKQLATTVGLGLVETLFNQGRIAADLAAIKAQLAALNDFIRYQLPLLISQVVEVELARAKESEIVEKAATIKDRIDTLRKARRGGASENEIKDIAAELVGHVDEILEMGGFLANKGQPYFASAGVSLLAALKGYAALIEEQPWRDGELRALALRWKARIEPWVSPAVSTSFIGVRAQLETRKALADKVVPTVQSWITGSERRFAISWGPNPFNNIPGTPPGPPSILVFGAWFALYQNAPANGNKLAQLLPPGMTFDEASMNGTLQFTIPEWWEVKANTAPSDANYDAAIGGLANLVAERDLLPARIAAVNGAISSIGSAIEQLDKILDGTKDAEVADVIAAANIVTVA